MAFFARPFAAAMAAALVASTAPAEAAEAIVRAPGLSVGVPVSAPALVPLATLPLAASGAPALAAPAFSALAAPAAAPALAAPEAPSALALPAAAAAADPADGALPAAAAPAAAEAFVGPASPTSASAAAPAVRAAALFDGARPAAAAEESDRPADAPRAAAPAPRARPGIGGRRPRGAVARAAAAVARATGLASLWGIYSGGVLIQRYAERLADQSREPKERAVSARRLAAQGSVDVVPLLGWAAENDPSPRVRRAALSALLRLAESASPRLIRTMKRNPFPVARETAATSLGWIVARMDAPEALEALGAVGVLDRSEGPRLAAIAALAGARSAKAVPTLLWMAGIETRTRPRSAIDAALAAQTARLAADGSGALAAPAEDLPRAAAPLHAAALKSSIAIGLAFAAVEFVGGLTTGTLALQADALHLAGDRALDAAALLAMWISRRPPTSRNTYGWLKIEAVMSFAGALAIAAMAAAMIPGVVKDFVHPLAAQGWDVLGFAALSVVSNLLSAAMLYRHQDGHLGVRGAFLHALTDAVGTFGVMIAAAVSLLWGFPWLMPVATAAMVLMVLRVAWELGHPAWHVLLDAVPPGVDMARLESDLGAVAGVTAVYDLHVRALNSQGAELVAKVYAEPGADRAAIIASANAFLRERYGIVHATIQIDEKPRTAPAAPSARDAGLARLARIGAQLQDYGAEHGLKGLEGRLLRGLDPAGALAVEETRAKLELVAKSFGAPIGDVIAFTNELHAGGIWANADRLKAASAPAVKAWIVAAGATTRGERVDGDDLAADEFLEDYDQVNRELEAAAADPEAYFERSRARLVARAREEFVLEGGVPVAKSGNGFLAMAVSGYKSGIVVDEEGKAPFVGAARLDYDALMKSRGLRRVSREDRGRRANFYVDAGGREIVKGIYPGLAVVLTGDMALAREMARAAAASAP